MGGDFGPSVTVPAAVRALAMYPDLNLVLLGDRGAITSLLNLVPAQELSRLEIVHTDSVVSDDSKPETVLRHSKNSSMFLAVNLVKEGRADACVSAGNTGALLLAGRHLLKTIPGVIKPAMIAQVPLNGVNRKTYILDVGANVSCDAEDLCGFAVMGSVQAQCDKNALASIALLNVGQELHKGTSVIREASAALSRSSTVRYVGFIEANEIFSGKADVIVCDGFSGNVTIKASAGVVRFIEQLVQVSLKKNLLTRLFGLLAYPFISSMKRQIDPAQFNGASVIGLQGIIVKSHGHASQSAFFHAIEQAYREVMHQIPSKIQAQIASFSRELHSSASDERHVVN